MQIIKNWTDFYTQSDSFRSNWRKADLIYLLNKYGRKVDGTPPCKHELKSLLRKQLNRIWTQIKPFEFGNDPIN